MAIILKSMANDGQPLEAVFLPEKGMNLISFKKGDLEIIDQATLNLFEERSAGLGALIGPHFHHRPKDQIPPVLFEEKFPHIARLKGKGITEPFSHGIARYAPWSYKSSETTIHARISGTDVWNDSLLSSLEGFNFSMYMDVQISSSGLFIELSVDAEKPSVVGFHYYYGIGGTSSYVSSETLNYYYSGDQKMEIPAAWTQKNMLHLPLDSDIDFGFYPKKHSSISEVLLHTQSHRLKIKYQSQTNESSFQIYHPKKASFVCIEPLSATFPRKPKLHSSGVNMYIEIV